MVKSFQRNKEIIKENERLEDMFKSILKQKKDQEKDLKDHKNKIFDLYFVVIESSKKNKKLIPFILNKLSKLIKKIMLTKKFNYLKKNKIFLLIRNFFLYNASK